MPHDRLERIASMKSWLYRHWFLLGLLLVFAVGLWRPQSFAELSAAKWFRRLILVGVLFITTLPVELAAIRTAIRRPWPSFLAIVISFGLMPLVAWPISKWLPSELAIGLMVMAATPATLASAAVWTRCAGGNELVPIMVTVITNLSCFIVTPLWLLWTLGETDVMLDLSFSEMVVKLIALVVLPMVAAQVARRSRGVVMWAARRKTWLTFLAQLGILTIVFVGAVQCGLRLRAEVSESATVWALISMFVIVVGLHVAMLVAGVVLSQRVGFSREDTIGVAFAGSEKTLMIGLQLAMMTGGGLILLPMVTYHFVQLIVDAGVAQRWSRDTQ